MPDRDTEPGQAPAATPPLAQGDGGAGTRGLARSAGVVGSATMASRVLGLVREQVLAYWFGASNAMDAFLVAFRVPNLVRDLFAEGAMSAALVPTFSKALAQEGRARAWRLGNLVLTALVLATGLLTAAAVVFAPSLVRALAGDFAEVPGKFELTVLLTRVMTPFLVLVAVAAACMGMLNSLGVFFVPALAPAMFNVASVAVGLALIPLFLRQGVEPILAMALGTLAGGLAQIALQVPPLWRAGFRPRPRLDLADPGLRQVLLLMGPGIVGLAATQLNVFVNTMVATGLGTGAVSWLGYAFRVMYLPIGLFGVSIATATTPAMARLAAAGDTARMRSTLADAVALMLTLNIPATFGLVALAEPIVRLLFERGSFTPEDTRATAAAVQLYALGLVGYSVVKIVSPTFYALGRSRVPATVGVAAVLLNAALCVASAPTFGFEGLAASASFAALANAGTLVVLACRALGGLELARLAGTTARVLACSAPMALAARWVQSALAEVAPGAGLGAECARLGAAIAAGVVVFLALAHAARIRDVAVVREALMARLRRRARR